MLSAKQILIFIAQIFCCAVCFAQTQTIDSLKKILPHTKDAEQVNTLNKIAELYFQQTNNEYDSNLILSGKFADKALQLAKQLHYAKGTGIALFNAGQVAGYTRGDYNHSVALLKEAFINLFKNSYI